MAYLGKALLGMLAAVALGSAALIVYARYVHMEMLSVRSGSMYPAISTGDAVLIRQVPEQFGALQAGDIISFRESPGSDLILTHRFTGYDAKGMLVMKGDANAQPDKPVLLSQLIGRVERIIPGAGYGLDFVRHPLGLLSAVYLPAVILAAGEIQRLGRHFEARYYRLHVYFDKS